MSEILNPKRKRADEINSFTGAWYDSWEGFTDSEKQKLFENLAIIHLDRFEKVLISFGGWADFIESISSTVSFNESHAKLLSEFQILRKELRK